MPPGSRPARMLDSYVGDPHAPLLDHPSVWTEKASHKAVGDDLTLAVLNMI